jgi:hypothetical protein
VLVEIVFMNGKMMAGLLLAIHAQMVVSAYPPDKKDHTKDI